MPRISFDPKVTLSGLASLLLLVVSIASAWAVREADINKLTDRSQKIEERAEQTDERVNQLRIDLAKSEQERTDIQRRLTDIQSKLDRLVEHFAGK